MNIKDENVKCLYDLGLTRLQAQVYLTLLTLGKSTVKEIAKESNIARQEIYRVLLEIGEAGIVEKILGYPTRYKPIPICDGISLLLKQRYETTKNIEKISRRIIKDHKKDHINDRKEEDFFVLIPKKDRFVKKLNQLFKESTKSIKVITSKSRLYSSKDSLIKEINKAGNRDVNLQLITEKDVEDKFLQDYWPKYKINVRYVLKTPPVVMAVVDKKEVLLITSASSDFAGSSALWSNNASQVELANNYFEILWLSAIDYPLKNQNYLQELAEEKSNH